jgi:hypothetical protein
VWVDVGVIAHGHGMGHFLASLQRLEVHTRPGALLLQVEFRIT